MRQWWVAGAAATLVGSAAILGVGPASASTGHPVLITIVHAIPGATVDVYGDDDRLADDLTFDGDDNPVEGDLNVGDTVRIRIVPGSNAEGDFTGALIDEDVTVPDVQGYTLVAAYDLEQEPALVPFEDLTDPLCEGESEVGVRNVSQNSGIDVFQDGELASENLQFGEEDSGPGVVGETSEIAVALTGQGIDNAGIVEDITFADGTVTTIYIVNGETTLIIDSTVGSENCDQPTATPTPTAEGNGDADEPVVVPTSVPAGATTASSAGVSPLGLGVLALVMLAGFVALRRRA